MSYKTGPRCGALKLSLRGPGQTSRSTHPWAGPAVACPWIAGDFRSPPLRVPPPDRRVRFSKSLRCGFFFCSRTRVLTTTSTPAPDTRRTVYCACPSKTLTAKWWAWRRWAPTGACGRFTASCFSKRHNNACTMHNMFAGDQQEKRSVFHSKRRESVLWLLTFLRHRAQERAALRKEPAGSEKKSGARSIHRIVHM